MRPSIHNRSRLLAARYVSNRAALAVKKPLFRAQAVKEITAIQMWIYMKQKQLTLNAKIASAA